MLSQFWFLLIAYVFSGLYQTNAATNTSQADQSMDWNEFLMLVFDRMAQNDVQSRKATLSFDTLKHWPSFRSFLIDDLEWSSKAKPELKELLESNEQELLENELHALLDATVGRPSFSEPNLCELKIQGHFVRLSEFEQLVSMCGDRLITATSFFAQHTVFIDADFSKVGAEMLLAVVAPIWEVIGDRTITLSGYPGRQLPQNATGDGEAGFAGGPSGAFFGVASNLVNATSLVIFTNGGDGGNGQMGRNGTDGHGDIDKFQVGHKSCSKEDFDFKLFCSSDTIETFEDRQITYEKKTPCAGCFFCCPWTTVEFKIISGPNAIGGFNGGKLGLGGKGSAFSEIVNLNEKTQAKIFSNDGNPGSSGQGGKGGLGAVKNGIYATDVHRKLFGFTCEGISCGPLPFKPGTRLPSAPDGLANFSGIQQPPKPIKHHNFYSIITNYRLFVAKKRTRTAAWLSNVAWEFIEQFSQNAKIQAMINLLDLTDEFIAIEDIGKQQPDKKQWLVHLDLLLQSVEAAANSNSSAVVAHYLSSAILSRKLSIEYEFDRNLIVDVQLFLSEVSNQIAKLAILDREKRLMALKLIYDQDINMKQQQAEVFLNRQFSAEVLLIQSKIEASISGLQREVTTLLAQSKANRKIYSTLIKEAQVKFALNVVLRFLKVASQFAKFTGPDGGLTGTVLDVSVGLAKDFVDLHKGVSPNTKVPAAIHTLGKIKRQFDVENEENIRVLEGKFQNLTSENPQEQQVLDEAKRMLAAILDRTRQFSTVQTELSATIDNLRRNKQIMESELLDRVQTSIFLKNPRDMVAYESLHQNTHSSTEIERSPTEIEKLKKGLKEVEDNIKKVAAYEHFVEASLSGYLKNLTELMTTVKNGASQSSAIPLEISRYNLQKVLQEVRTIINKYTTGFKANEELIVCIDMLDNLMRTTINVYDQLQKYCDQKNLAELIVGINQVSITQDSRVNAALRQLDHKIVSNTIQAQYARVSQAFQQLVFPFAPIFLPALRISETGHDDEVMQLMISKISNLQSKINDLRSSVINGYDEQLFSFKFGDQHPFYTWNEHQHEQKIMALLQGDEVAFKAPVYSSVANAVKFQDIRLEFVASNISEQYRLDAHLNQTNVRLTHAGNSQYKCGDRYYVISHQQQVIEMSVAADGKGEPVVSNEVYKKIKAGNILLSPYTLWKMRIVHRFGGTLSLGHMFGKVQLKLVGTGQYIKENNPICNQPLERFYQLDEIYG